VDVKVPISTPSLYIPINIILCDLHYRAVRAGVLFVVRGEAALLHSVWGDQPFREAFKELPPRSFVATAVPTSAVH
jgi:hypothetical protein